MRPQAATTSSTAAAIPCSSPTSATASCAVTPSAANSSTARQPPASSMSTTNTFAPSLPKRRAMPKPIPVAAPVTTATRSVNRCIAHSYRRSAPDSIWVGSPSLAPSLALSRSQLQGREAPSPCRSGGTIGGPASPAVQMPSHSCYNFGAGELLPPTFQHGKRAIRWQGRDG